MLVVGLIILYIASTICIILLVLHAISYLTLGNKVGEISHTICSLY